MDRKRRKRQEGVCLRKTKRKFHGVCLLAENNRIKIISS